MWRPTSSCSGNRPPRWGRSWAKGRLFRPDAELGLDDLAEVLQRLGADQYAPVDEKGRRPGDPKTGTLLHVRLDRRLVLPAVQALPEALEVEVQLFSRSLDLLPRPRG